MRIGLGADHAGQSLKRELGGHLSRAGHETVDFGSTTADPVDYPEYAARLARAVAAGEVERGIFACGSGIGPAVAANKIAGVRAAVVSDEWSARDAVEHVGVNFLTLGERVVGVELAKSIVDAYLGAKVSRDERHARRRGQIAALDGAHASAGAGAPGDEVAPKARSERG